MEIKELSTRSNDLINELIRIWERSVRATHNFLNDKLIQEIKQYIPLALKEVQHLIVAFQDNKHLGFIGINDRKIEMLFVDSNLIGKGVGTCLINFVFDKYNVNEVVVNEQNPNAHIFT